MDRMVEVNVIRRLMDFHPRNRIAGFIAVAHRSQQRAVHLDLVVAIHARLRSRHVGVAGLFDVRVALPTIETELARVKRMTERHRLHWRVTDIGVTRRRVIGDPRSHKSSDQQQIHQNLKRKLVDRFGKEIRHVRKLAGLNRVTRAGDGASIVAHRKRNHRRRRRDGCHCGLREQPWSRAGHGDKSQQLGEEVFPRMVSAHKGSFKKSGISG